MGPKVSVLIITYNHEKYIAQTVASALNQEVNFQYEILVGDDCSTDHTREILKELAIAHPERIRLFLREEKGSGLPGKTNFVETLKACRGEYVALLDGDDYWTDVTKLQKQVNFLDAKPEFAVCFHNVEVAYEDQSQESWNYCPVDQKETSTIEDLLERNFIATSSTVFRRSPEALPDWFLRMKTGDWALHVLNAQRGKVGYIDEVMSVYRIHHGGYWSKQETIQNTLDEIVMFQALGKYLPRKHSAQIKSHLASLFYKLADQYNSRGEKRNALVSALRSLGANPGDQAILVRHVKEISYPRFIARIKALLGGKSS
jgi:glycosyltransferase involved in cell wall biosynthesis